MKVCRGNSKVIQSGSNL